MTRELHITYTKQAYSRSGEVRVTIGECDVCGEEKIVICTDSSQGEYGEIAICLNCTKLAHGSFEQFLIADEPTR